MDDNIIVVDCETTGLEPDRHELWDIALIETDGTEHEWHLRPAHPDRADPGALRITRFYERTAARDWKWFSGPNPRTSAAQEIVALTANKHLVGAVPWFDAGFLGKFLIDNGQREAWNYHMVDVETLAAGYLRGRQRRAGRGPSDTVRPPWSLAKIAELLDLDIADPRFEKHTAIGDARLARAIYLKVMGDAVGLSEEGGL